MSDEFEEDLPFEAAEDAEAEALIVDVDGYEGPLHLLLALARKKKVDLAKISILELAEQYLKFVEDAHRKRLDLAAEYLVMASWLAYLKSRLLLPKPLKDDEPEPEALAASLAFRLRRLEAMRLTAQSLFQRDLFRREVFPRGAPEGVRTLRAAKYEADLHDLLRAYATRRQSRVKTDYAPKLPKVYGMETARGRLEMILPEVKDWRNLEDLFPDADDLGEDPPPHRSVVASSTLAALEITKDGRAKLRQDEAFAPIKVKGSDGADQT